MNVFSQKVELQSKKQFELIDITPQVTQALEQSKISEGVVNVFSNHTTASIRLNHNEPMLIQDIMKTLYTAVPIEANYAHDLFEMRQSVDVDERSNGHAHVKAFILGSSESIPVKDGKMMLGEKQSLFFVELDGGRDRDFIINIVGQ